MTVERTTSRDTASLLNRIAANNRFGSADLTQWLLDRMRLLPAERLLDIGCGTGVHLVEFGRAGANCTGIDISGQSVETARQHAADAGVSMDLWVADMDGLVAKQAFDTVTALYSLYYSHDAARVLDRARQLLAPGGRIIVFGPYSDNNAEWFDFLTGFMTLPEPVLRSTTSFMFDVVLRFAQDHFSDIACERFENIITIPSVDELRRYWRSNVYYDETLDPAFERAAAVHFATNAAFRYRKVGQLIEMRGDFTN